MSYAPNVRDTRKPERATERIEVRWRPSEKEAVRRAAEAAGLPLATVVVNGALREVARLGREAKSNQQGC
jgi:uncharacterized protein (DUF1778 family)